MKPKPLPSADQLRNRTKNGTTNRSAPKSCGSCCYSVVSAVGYDLNPFYGKVVEVDGFVIASSAAVSDDALYEAALTFAKMTEGRPDLVTNLIKEGVHLAVIGKDEVLTDIPEYSILDSSSWDWARGVGATQWIPVTSCAEENLLCLDDDAYRGENICIHETAHSLQGSGGKLPLPRTIELNGSDDLDQALRALYTQAVEVDKLWAGVSRNASLFNMIQNLMLWCLAQSSSFSRCLIYRNIPQLIMRNTGPKVFKVSTMQTYLHQQIQELNCNPMTTVCIRSYQGSFLPTLLWHVQHRVNVIVLHSHALELKLLAKTLKSISCTERNLGHAIGWLKVRKKRNCAVRRPFKKCVLSLAVNAANMLVMMRRRDLMWITRAESANGSERTPRTDVRRMVWGPHVERLVDSVISGT